MLVSEFIRKKNKILHKATGLDLVPENQIEECAQYPLSVEHDAAACPYCVAYPECYNCPMEEDDNNCLHPGSTYSVMRNTCQGPITNWNRSWHKDLLELIKQYNSELEK